jgi:hypothetical protein
MHVIVVVEAKAGATKKAQGCHHCGQGRENPRGLCEIRLQVPSISVG